MSLADVPIAPADQDLAAILAKSNPPESLIEHTWWVLSRLADQHRLRPTLAADTGNPRLWHWLYWGTFLHDFGKAADGFQAVLTGRKREAEAWGSHRHEALSLAFVDWLFPGSHPDRPYVIAVIACHHRDAEVIRHRYLPNRDYPEEDSATRLVAQAGKVNQQLLYRWLANYGWAWAEALGFAPDLEMPELPPLEAALARIRPSALWNTFTQLHQYTDPLRFSSDPALALTGTLLRGLILTSDHAGSAHSGVFLPAPLERAAVTQVIGSKTLFPHQTAAEAVPSGSALLISPTSSGKTEAALLWLARQQLEDGLPAPRIFYLLPYQASMNATQKRLLSIFPKETVGLQHSRMMQVLYRQALADQDQNDTAVAYAYQKRELTRLLFYPVTVMSPYQLLKVPYQLKGFEALLTHFYNGRFILDEIHAYEPSRLALIIAVVQFLHQFCRARFFIMTATLPAQVRAKLQAALPGLQVIEADADTFRRFQRHRVHLLPGDLLAPETLKRIVEDAATQSILICCNTVRRAFEVHAAVEQALKQRYPDGDYQLVLLHSRFTSKDRNEKEDRIMRRTGVNSDERGRTIVIATQVVEVSLNIDLDTLYSEAAPLEALLQRFGRVNRGRGADAPLADVYVMREQDTKAVEKIYDLDLIDAGLACLEAADGEPIDESLVSAWLERVYTGAALEKWEQEYTTSFEAFQREVMRSLRPFNSSDLEDQFSRLFDGIDILPSQYLDQYESLIRAGNYLEAAGWLVPIAWRDYKRLEKLGKAGREPLGKRGDLFVANVPYDSDSGLDLYGAYAAEAAKQRGKTALDDYPVEPEAD